MKRKTEIGTVYLVGAGPGDEELITLKGLRLLREADVVFYDYLANPALLRHAPKTARAIYVGKKDSGATQQAAIDAALIEEARKGHRVVRLKGGDPFIFGRGGEEAQALKKAGVPFEIVPGVTSAIAVPAYAGIPLTHRQLTSEVVFVTGHEEPGKSNYSAGAPHWEALAKMGTIVFLMGTVNLRANLSQLARAGRDPKTPCAIIRWGSYGRQKTLTGTLATLADRVEREALGPPAIVVVGEVVSLREIMNWFEQKPLFGKTVLVTRARAQASELSALLRRAGAEPVELPTVEIRPPASFDALDRAIAGLKDYDWIFFTSANGADFFWQRLRRAGLDRRALSHLKVGAVGAKTAAKLGSLGLSVDLLPEDYSSEGLVRAVGAQNIRKAKVLIPRARQGSPALIDELKRRHCAVDAVEAYENVPPSVSRAELEAALLKQKPDWVVFTSSSSVEHLSDLLKREGMEAALAAVKVAVIGPMTRQSAIERGLSVSVMPREATMEALVEALEKFTG